MEPATRKRLPDDKALPEIQEGVWSTIGRYGKSRIDTCGGIYHLRLAETTSYGNGVAHGMLLRIAFGKTFDLYEHWGVRFALKTLRLVGRRRYGDLLVPDPVKDELRGLEHSLEIPIRRLHSMNFIYDAMAAIGAHCSTLVMSSESGLVIGRNTDLLPPLARFLIKRLPTLLISASSRGCRSFTHLGIPTQLGVFIGRNQSGITVSSHAVISVRDERSVPGLGTTLAARRILEQCESLDDAARVIRNCLPSRPINLLVASQSERATRIFEVHGSGIQERRFPAGDACCTTHYEDPFISQFHRGSTADSRVRLDSLRDFLEHRTMPGSVRDVARAALVDHRHGLTYRKTARSICNNGTVQSMVIDERGGMLVGAGRCVPVPMNGVYVYVPPAW